MGLGLQSEITATRFQIAEAQKKIAAKTAVAEPVAAPALPVRKSLVFAPKLPGVSKTAPGKKKVPGTRRKIVVKVNVKPPSLRRSLGLKA